MNIILIIIDSLRPDHLSVNGYNRNTSPNIDNFYRQGTSFLNAYTSLPRTNPSLMSLFTGLYPHTHGIRLVKNDNLNFSFTHLPEILINHGYETAFMGNAGLYEPPLRKGFKKFNLLSWKIKNKIKRGLKKVLNPRNFMSSTEQYIDVAIKWIKKNSKKKFFLCLHFDDMHWPYEIPKPYDHTFDPNYKGNHDFNTLKHGKFSRGELMYGHIKFHKEEISHAIAHYDGSIKYTDLHFGRLIDFVKSKSLDDNTLIILTSDHGENFGEHNFYFLHGSSLYEPSLRVPLIFNYPKFFDGCKVIKERVRLLDIMPTILEMLNIPVLDKIDGVSLLPLINNNSKNKVKFIFAESMEEIFKENKRIFFPGVKGKWRAMIEGDWKIIYIPHPEKDIFELYNLTNDPNEQNNLIDKEKERASYMKDKILEFLKPQSNEGQTNLSDLTEKSRETLRKAGYIN